MEAHRAAISDWYNSKYAREQEKSYRPLAAYEHILAQSQFTFTEGERILDVGSGQGFLLKAATQHGLLPFGIDISSQAVAIARRSIPSEHVVVGQGEDLPFPAGYFDYVTCLGSLEHHLDMQRAVAEFYRVGKPDAQYIFLVPNRNFLGYKLTPESGTEQQEIQETLLDLAAWRSLFEAGGFTITDIHIDDWFLAQPFDLSDGMRRTIRLLLRKIALTAASFQTTYAYTFICTK